MRTRPRRRCRLIVCVAFLAVACGLIPEVPAQSPPTLAGCPVLPANSIWNTPIDTLPTDPNSGSYVTSIGAAKGVHPDFGAGLWNGGPIGIPYNLVPGSQPTVPISFDYADESDPGPYPLPADPAIEGGSQASGDRHVLVLDRDSCVLYETWSTYPENSGGWHAGSGALFDLKSNNLRPSGWTSSDAAGLPVLPGLVRYEEVAAGEIHHAIRFTAPQTRKEFIWPARHYASNLTDRNYPPMGQRFRLRASFNIAGFAPEVQVILQALKKYGMILADNGSSWYLSGVPDPRWNDDLLVNQLDLIKGSDFEAVDESSLMLDPDSGETRTGFPPLNPDPPDRPIISVAPGSHTFGRLSVGETSAPRTFTIANTGQGLLVIGLVGITGQDREEFSEAFDGCSDQTLGPADNCTEHISFAPHATGRKTAALIVPANDALRPEVSIPLSGTAVEPTTLTLVSPNGGESWEAESKQEIRWRFTGKPGSSVKIELLKGGTSVRTIRARATVDLNGVGAYSWLIPEHQPPGNDYRIKITSTQNAIYRDTSDQAFTISVPPPPTITLVAPNGGESWQEGTTQMIQWAYTGNPGPFVRLQLVQGITVVRTVAAKIPTGEGLAGSFNWKIPFSLNPAGSYKVKVTSRANASLKDESNESFSVYK